MARTKKIVPVPTKKSLPATLAELQSQAVNKGATLSLLAEVKQAYAAIYENQNFRKYREATEQEETVEGSMQDDDTHASQMLRKKGIEMGLPLLSKAQTHSITLKLRTVERGFNAERKQRAKADEGVE